MENSIIKAEIKSKFSKVGSIFEYLMLALSIVWIIPLYEGKYHYYYNIFSVRLFEYDDGSWGLCPYLIYGIIAFAASFVAIVFMLYTKDITKECSIELTSEGINGRRKGYGSKADLRLPIEKIDSIFVTETVFDKLRGGKTLGIRSNTGVIKFICVQNADEFVTAANKAIEENKKANRTVSVAPAAPVVQATSNADELKKYKDLLDSGVITQEEFDAKKKQILGL